MSGLKMRVRAEKIAELRELAAQAIVDSYTPGYSFGGGGPVVWSDCVDGMLGGPTGAYCAAVHPDLLLALLDELERLREEAS